MRNIFFYFLPFFLFGGIQIIFLMIARKEKQILPCFIGKNWNDLLTMPNIYFFSFALGALKMNKSFEHGYILEQYPSPGSLVKKNQKVVLVLNENPSVIEKKDYRNYIHNSVSACDSLLKNQGLLYKIVRSESKEDIVSYVGGNRNGILYLYPHKNRKILFIKNNVSKNCHLIQYGDIKKVCYTKNNEIIIDCQGKIIKKQSPASNVIFDCGKKNNIFLWHDS
jgi:hypothetical protein